MGYEFKRRRFEQLHRAALRYASPPSSHRLHSPSQLPQRGRVTVAKDDGRNVNAIANDQVEAARGDVAAGNVMSGVEFEYVGLGLGAGRGAEENEAKKGEVCRLSLAVSLPLSPAFRWNILLTTYELSSTHPSALRSSRPCYLI